MRKDVPEILAMPDRRVRFWRAYLDRVPDLEERSAFYLTQIAAVLINANTKGSTTVKPSELDPWDDPWPDTSGDELDELGRGLMKPKTAGP